MNNRFRPDAGIKFRWGLEVVCGVCEGGGDVAIRWWGSEQAERRRPAGGAHPAARASLMVRPLRPPSPRRAVLSLDDDILMPCSDLEAAFALWRASPRQLVGWYPRLLLPAGGEHAPGPPVYQFEPAVFKQVGRGLGLAV